MIASESIDKTNLLGLCQAGLTDFFKSINQPKFRATQLLKWIHAEGVTDFSLMTNLPKPLREELSLKACIQAPPITHESIATDGTRKWLLSVGGGSIETVYIPEKDRATLCISSQVGCILNCKFCYTAQQGFQRNLTASEIIGQVWQAWFTLKKQNILIGKRPITNVVLMGMGEPLLNYPNVLASLKIMLDDNGYGLSKRKVTLSTSGVVPMIDKLREDIDVALAISLHAPNDELRSEIVPLNKKYNIEKLLDSCKRFVGDDKKRTITIEYIMLDGINDTIKHAQQLIKVLDGLPCKINLIPFNPFPGTNYNTSTVEAVELFQKYLVKKGIMAFTRKRRGDQILAACGQLAGKVKDRTKRSLRLKVNQPPLNSQSDARSAI
jgi:23S rRNA (adenine2503-C2)-methyltransferase